MTRDRDGAAEMNDTCDDEDAASVTLRSFINELPATQKNSRYRSSQDSLLPLTTDTGLNAG